MGGKKNITWRWGGGGGGGKLYTALKKEKNLHPMQKGGVMVPMMGKKRGGTFSIYRKWKGRREGLSLRLPKGRGSPKGKI